MTTQATNEPAYPVPSNEKERLQALHELEILDTPPSPGFDRICERACELLGIPMSTLSLVDRDRQWFKARVGIDAVETAREVAFCNHTILDDAPLIVPDARADARFAANPLVTGENGIRFYAGVPVSLRPGVRIGTLCVIDTQPRRFTPEQERGLVFLGEMARNEILLHKTNLDLRVSHERYQALTEASASIVWRSTADGLLTDVSLRGAFRGLDAEALLADGWLSVVHPEDLPAALRAVEDGIKARKPFERVERIVAGDGRHRWVRIQSVPLPAADGTIREWVGSCIDIHDRRMAEEDARLSQERLMLSLGAAKVVAWEHDIAFDRLTVSANAREVIGLETSDMADFLARIHPDDQDKVRQHSDPEVANEFRYAHPDGHEIWLASRATLVTKSDGRQAVMGVSYDISARKRAQEEAWRAANHDPLTGLANRSLFQSRLERAVAHAAKSGTPAHLLLLDLDDFKAVNDSFGHEVGDALLRHVADCLRANLRDGDTIARFGGDEFAILLGEPFQAADARLLAERILQGIEGPLTHAGQTVGGRVSIGLASCPDHGASATELLKAADLALCEAKANGRHRVVPFSPAMLRPFEDRVRVSKEMRTALPNGEVMPHYQPKVCLATGRITGFEALARWLHPQQGLLTPGAFSSVFEDHDLSARVGDLINRSVIADVRAWLDMGLDVGRVAVNFSTAQFMQPDLAERLLRALEDGGVPTRHFEVEVTETVLLGRSSEGVARTLETLHEAGVSIAMDDFGTGFASLTHLKQFPVDRIKIDRSFVQDIERDPDDAAIVSAITGLSRSLGTTVIAEGVETTGQAAYLRRHGCQEAQGFLYAKAMPARRVPGFLQTWVPRLADNHLAPLMSVA